jgi:hypothetical protein
VTKANGNLRGFFDPTIRSRAEVKQPSGEPAPPARLDIGCRRWDAPSLLCQIGNTLVGELPPQIGILKEHRSSFFVFS